MLFHRGHLTRFAIAAALVGASFGCGGHIPVPPDLGADATVIPITNRKTLVAGWADDPFVMGPYQVSHLDRTWTKSGPGWDFFGIVAGEGASRASLIRDYAYDFAGPGGQVRGECATEFDELKVQTALANADRKTFKIGCRCVGAGLSATFAMAGPDNDWRGNVDLHGFGVPIHTILSDSNGVALVTKRPLGFDVRGDKPLGMLETRDPGQVWLSRQLDPVSNAELACLFAGLLLYKEPS